jgi:hypothetical protein
VGKRYGTRFRRALLERPLPKARRNAHSRAARSLQLAEEASCLAASRRDQVEPRPAFAGNRNWRRSRPGHRPACRKLDKTSLGPPGGNRTGLFPCIARAVWPPTAGTGERRYISLAPRNNEVSREADRVGRISEPSTGAGVRPGSAPLTMIIQQDYSCQPPLSEIA